MTATVERARSRDAAESGNQPGSLVDGPRADLHSRVLERIGNAVVSGLWPPGTVFRTEDLAADVRVSLSVAREAVRVAESLGLVASRKRVGVRVLGSPQWMALDPRVLRWQVAHEPEQEPLSVRTSVVSVLLGLAPAAAATAAGVANAEEVADISAAAVALAALPGAARLACLVTTVVGAVHDPVYRAVADMAKAVDAWSALSEAGDPSSATALAIAIQRGQPAAARNAMHVLVAPTSGPSHG
jgi:DNA-binding FadR family transcriptional regulator